MSSRKYSIILGNLGNTCDRFLSSGYKDQPSSEEQFKTAASIPDVEGIELVGSWDITTENVKKIRSLLEETEMTCSSIIPDHFSRKIWGKGAFTSRDPGVRRKAVEHTKEMIDAGAELGCDLVNIWPGQDGYDYPLQGNFDVAYQQFLEAIKECADHRPETRIALEFKPKEPRNFSYLARSADTLLMALDTERDNVGVTIDTGHAMVAGENMAEAAARLLSRGKLFHLHFNDNYRSWDDDMIVGSVHHVEYIELLYWLRKLDYQGWYSMDQYPYREDGKKALAESIETVKALEKVIGNFGDEKISQLVSQGDATEITAAVRKMLFS
jgi:sugar phosphate isomerase/epimerase